MLQLTIDWNPSPELFKIGSLSIRYYGLMFVVSFLLGIQIMKKIMDTIISLGDFEFACEEKVSEWNYEIATRREKEDNDNCS